MTVKFLTVGQVMDRYAVSRAFVMGRLEAFGAIRCGRVYRIPETGLESFESTRRVGSHLSLPLSETSRSTVDRAIDRIVCKRGAR